MIQDKMKARMRRGNTGRDSSSCEILHVRGKSHLTPPAEGTFSVTGTTKLSRDSSIERFCCINSRADN